MFYYELVIAGFGGQGVLLIGDLLAHTAMEQGLEVTYMPSYGVEMRGGSVKCTLVISSEEIGSPIVDHPHGAILMSQPSFEEYESLLMPGGLLVVNTSLVDLEKAQRNDLKVLSIRANEEAQALGTSKLANMVALGAFLERSKVLPINALIDAMPRALDPRFQNVIPLNRETIKRGSQLAKRAEDNGD